MRVPSDLDFGIIKDLIVLRGLLLATLVKHPKIRNPTLVGIFHGGRLAATRKQVPAGCP